ncbi:sigma factor-like helix-turn-helix DNA-binding protein [Gemmiger sp.]
MQLRAEGYTYAEIAVQLHISESSARVIEHRTRSWLKEILTKEGYDL